MGGTSLSSSMTSIDVPMLSRRATLQGEITLNPAVVHTPKMKVLFDEEGRVDLDSMVIKDDDFNPEKFAPRAQSRASVAQDTPVQIDPEVLIPGMNIVILLCGSRGDVQPFLAFGNWLKSKGHRVRIGTHDMFRDFVVKNGLEFYPIGGDPRALMEHMLKNPGIMPGSLEEIQDSRDNMREIFHGCWDAVTEPISMVTTTEEEEKGIQKETEPWQTHAIISNPPAFAHYHVAERLGVPLHIFFTMPWSPTKEFPHPLANMSFEKRTARRNLFSYYLVDTLTWTGLGDMVNNLRTKSLGLPPVTATVGQTLMHYSHVPHTYTWSPALSPKPKDWGPHIDICGFFYLSLGCNYTPPPDLQKFLDAGDPPIYVGFGSIVMEDPAAMTRIIFEAFEETGYRGIVSKGWAGLGEGQTCPENIYLIGDCPHDWLFERVSAVCHHGGAGTTAAGLRAGKPTIICPFFGDQPFWGQMIANRKVGPTPVRGKVLTAEALMDAFRFVMQPKTKKLAKELAESMAKENGIETGGSIFHAHLPLEFLKCEVDETQPAVIYCFDCDLCVCAEVHHILHENDSTHRWFRYSCCNWNPEIFLPGVHHIVAGVAGGVTESLMLIPSLFQEPWQGFWENGMTGLVRGIWRGIKGVFVYPWRGIIIFVREIESGMFTPSWHHDVETNHGRFILLGSEMDDTTLFKGKWMELSQYFETLEDMVKEGAMIGEKLPGYSENPFIPYERFIFEARKEEVKKKVAEIRKSKQKRWEDAPEEKEEREINVPVALCLTLLGFVMVSLAYSLVIQMTLARDDFVDMPEFVN